MHSKAMIAKILVLFAFAIENFISPSVLLDYHVNRRLLRPIESHTTIQKTNIQIRLSMNYDELERIVHASLTSIEKELENENTDLYSNVGLQSIEKQLEEASPYVAGVLGTERINIPDVALSDEFEEDEYGYTNKGNRILLGSRKISLLESKLVVNNFLVSAQWATETNTEVLKRNLSNGFRYRIVGGGKYFDTAFTSIAAMEALASQALDGDKVAEAAFFTILIQGTAYMNKTYNEALRFHNQAAAASIALKALNGETDYHRGVSLAATANLLSNAVQTNGN